MILLAALMIGLGICGLLKKETMLGFLISFQFLVLGCVGLFLASGGPRGHLVGLMILVSSILYSTGMLAMTIRLHFMKRGTRLDDLRRLKR